MARGCTSQRDISISRLQSKLSLSHQTVIPLSTGGKNRNATFRQRNVEQTARMSNYIQTDTNSVLLRLAERCLVLEFFFTGNVIP
jgi:hypothetical protein